MNLPVMLFVLLWHFAPLSGLATWYGPPQFQEGDIMRNGEALDLAAHTVAVDTSHLSWLDRFVVVLTECGGVHLVRITDTGPLYEAGRFRLGASRVTRQLRYWAVWDAEPVLTDTIEWQEDETYKVIVDFPQKYFLGEVVCDGNETVKVKAYLLTDH